jgi:hypothetical protein
MCAFCSAINLPVCAADVSCSSTHLQNAKLALISAGPVLGGATVWLKSTINRRKKNIK